MIKLLYWCICVFVGIGGEFMDDDPKRTFAVSMAGRSHFHINPYREIIHYYRSPDRKIHCLKGWSHPETLCQIPICPEGCETGHCIAPGICQCNQGWMGARCQICDKSSRCINGYCKNDVSECICHPGWSGPYCDIPTCDECVNGHCEGPNFCLCSKGWFGRNCTECFPDSHCTHGFCHSNPGECVCNPGWEGPNCEQAICKNGCHSDNGFCFNPGQCFCRSGWTGERCELCVPLPGCKHNRCHNNVPWTCSEDNNLGVLQGFWSQWSSWSHCSKSCGEGFSSRERDCITDSTDELGVCVGGGVERRRCANFYCAIDGAWSIWSHWSICSVSCGKGYSKRIRVCNSPHPKYGGEDCHGDKETTKKCLAPPCPKGGNWSEWGPWTICSRSCGGGFRHRKRVCNTPKPENGGRYCFGANFEAQTCNKHSCQSTLAKDETILDAELTIWSRWSECSCSNGTQLRERKCLSSPPCSSYELSQVRLCTINCSYDQNMSRNGTWSVWSHWSKCSTSCGLGITIRGRLCNNPIPSKNGSICLGLGYETKTCLTSSCHKGSHWEIWALWSKCSVTCGKGARSRKRICVRSKITNSPCKGESVEKGPCFKAFCPIHGEWSPWKPWSQCSVSCGRGLKVRIRKCDDPQPESEGRHCIGPSMEKMQCDKRDCFPHGGLPSYWSEWGGWSVCYATCGKTIRHRVRSCIGHSECPGRSSESSSCIEIPCGNVWNSWEEWSKCSASCGDGIRYRRRYCGLEPCSGYDREEDSCELPPCSVDGGWTDWTTWSNCSTVCRGDKGLRIRLRYCNDPSPQYGGKNCIGPARSRVFCTGNISSQSQNPGGLCYKAP